jgi:hypothetical protein
MSDITTRLRQTRADMLGTDDEQHYWDCHEAAAEIERLRLTDEEREALATVLRRTREDFFTQRYDDSVTIAAVVDGLLERTK